MVVPPGGWFKVAGGLSLALLLISLVSVMSNENRDMAHEVREPEPEGEFEVPDGHVPGWLLFAPDSKQFVAAATDRPTRQGRINVWDIKTRKLVRTLAQPDDVSALVFTPDGQRLVTAGWDKKLYVYIAPGWQVEHAFNHDPPNQVAQRLAMLPDGKHFLSGNSGYQGPRLWDLDKREATPLGGPKEQVAALAILRDGKRFIVAYSAPIAEVWDAETLQVVGRLTLEKQERYQGVFVSAAFSPDGQTIATGYLLGSTHPVALWDAKTFKKRHDCHGLPYFARSIAFTPDSKLLVACSGPDERKPTDVLIWDVTTGARVFQFHASQHGGMQMALSPDGRWLVHSDAKGKLRLWDFAKLRREIGK
jgi:WD40 repeat protein